MLSEKICYLRRQSGLSQEQLAEKVGVSRQAISKWETGQSVPELDKLIKLSECFGVSMDELARENPPEEQRAPANLQKGKAPISKPTCIGTALCFAGAMGFILIGAIMIFSPETAGQIGQSSAVTLNGSGLSLAGCVLMMTVGIFFILRQR